MAPSQRYDPSPAAFLVDGVKSPVVGGRGVRDVKVGVDRLVVAHDLAPEDLLAQVHFPTPGEFAPALHLGLGDDLVPAVFRVAKDGRPGLFQAVDFGPQAAGFGHGRRGGQRRDPFGQPPQHGPILGRHAQIVASESRDDPLRYRLLQPGRRPAAVVRDRGHGMSAAGDRLLFGQNRPKRPLR